MTKEESKLQMHEAFEEEYLRGYKQGFKDRAKESDLEHITCITCKHFGRSVEDWKDGECPMEMIGDSTKEYCWKWETR